MTTRPFMLAALLAGGAAVHRAAAQAPDAPALYNENCKKCHGVLGNPPKTMKVKFPKIASFDARFVAEHPKDSIVKVLVKGVGKADDMKSFKDKLTAPEMEAVAAYVLELGKKAH